MIAKEKMEGDKIDLYAKRIQNLERELGIEVTIFRIGEMNNSLQSSITIFFIELFVDNYNGCIEIIKIRK